MVNRPRLAGLADRAGLRALIAVYLVSAAACCALAATARAGFVDLHVYRMGADAVLHQGSLYQVRWRGLLPFTYPPFAAVAFAAFAPLPWQAAAALLTALSVAALPIMFYLALRLRPVSGWLCTTDAARLAVAAAVLAIWFEPVRSVLSFGQVDLVLAVVVLADLALPDAARGKGVAIGVAAGLKLTPGIFAVYLLLTRRYRAAALAGLAFAGTVGIGYAVIPAGSRYFYWDLNFLRPDRIGHVQDVLNQSLLGAVARDIEGQPGAPWLALVALVGLAGLAAAAAAGRRGNDAAGFGLCAVAGLLASPISWTHHWVIALPALLLGGVAIWRRHQEYPARTALWLTGIALLAVIGWTGLARRVPSAGPELSPFWLVISQVYVLAGLMVLATAVWPGHRTAGSKRDHARPRAT